MQVGHNCQETNDDIQITQYSHTLFEKIQKKRILYTEKSYVIIYLIFSLVSFPVTNLDLTDIVLNKNA